MHVKAEILSAEASHLCPACSQDFIKHPRLAQIDKGHTLREPRQRKLAQIGGDKSSREFFCQGCSMTVLWTVG